MESRTLYRLEFNKILDKLTVFASSEKGKINVKNLIPASTFQNAIELQNETEEAYNILFQQIKVPYFSVNDIDSILEFSKKSIILTMGDLLKVAQNIIVASKLLKLLSECKLNYLKKYYDKITDESEFAKEIEIKIISENEMADTASDKLRSIRYSILRIGEKIKEKLNSYINGVQYRKYLQDTIITIRDGRYVIPVKSEYKNFVKGLVCGQSQSGATTFIEPIEVLQLNNELKEMYSAEQAEIERILEELTEKTAQLYEALKSNNENIACLDGIFAKAYFAENIKAVKPKLNDKRKIEIIQGRHPLIESKKVVPVDIKTGEKFLFLLISGPNTGGKTVTLKMTGLFCLMAYSGLFLPAYEAEIAFFKDIFCDIGDEQNIELSLSTFSAHLANIVEICKKADNNSLVLLDELGAGTDPSEGACLAVAVSEFLLNKGVIGVITSHFNELKEYAMTEKRMENASMDFNPETFEPTYKLNLAAVGASNALKIAKRLGLDSEIINKAENMISPEKVKFEKIINAAEESKKIADKNRAESEENLIKSKKILAEIEKEKKELDKMRDELNYKLKAKTNDLLEDYINEAEVILNEIKELSHSSDVKNIFKVGEMKKRLENLKVPLEEKPEPETTDEKINVSDKVLIKSLNTVAVVKSINKNNAVVILSSNIESNVKINDLAKLKKPASEKLINKKVNYDKIKNSTVTVSKEINSAQPGSKINVIGQNLDEAIYNVDMFIDKALIAGYSEITIIHGRGKGILKEGLSEHFKNHPNVKDFRAGRFGEGEGGVTVVTLQ